MPDEAFRHLRELGPRTFPSSGTVGHAALLLIDAAAIDRARPLTGVKAASHDDGGLTVFATQGHLDDYVVHLGADGIAVRGLQLDVTPLESLFFQLTAEPGPPRPAAPRPPEQGPPEQGPPEPGPREPGRQRHRPANQEVR